MAPNFGRHEPHEGGGPPGLEGRGTDRLADVADQGGDDRFLFRVDLVRRLGQPRGARRRRRGAVLTIRGKRVLDRRIDQLGIGVDDPRCDAAVDRRYQLVARLFVAAILPPIDP